MCDRKSACLNNHLTKKYLAWIKSVLIIFSLHALLGRHSHSVSVNSKTLQFFFPVFHMSFVNVACEDAEPYGRIRWADIWVDSRAMSPAWLYGKCLSDTLCVLIYVYKGNISTSVYNGTNICTCFPHKEQTASCMSFLYTIVCIKKKSCRSVAG